jgi:transcription antitermination factor NusG
MLENKGYETFLPLYQKRRRYSSRVKDSQLPLFPGYVFCRFNPLTRLPILTTPGVIQLVGSGRTAIPIDDREIISLQTALNIQVSTEPLPFLLKGQKVRITGGPLAGVEGIVLGIKQCLRLVLSITLLQRSVLVEVDRECVSPEDTVTPARAFSAAS